MEYQSGGWFKQLVPRVQSTRVRERMSRPFVRIQFLMGLADAGRGALSASLQGPGIAPYSSGKAVAWLYNEALHLRQVRYAGGAVNNYRDFDERGNPQTVVLAAGTQEERTITYRFHPKMRTLLSRTEASVLSSGSKVSVWDYDDPSDPTDDASLSNEKPSSLVHRLIERGYTQDISGSVIPYEYITTFTYNQGGQLLSVDGPAAGSDDTLTYSYDAASNLQSIAFPLIGSTVFSSYDAAGNIGHMADVNGQEKSFTYDGRNRAKEILNHADSSLSRINYSSAGLVESKIDEDGVSQTFAYDPTYGRLSQKADQMGNTIDYLYDLQGNLTQTDYKDPSGTLTRKKRWSYQHPSHPGRLWKEIQANDTYTAYDYDGAGNVSSFQDPDTNITTYRHDALDRVVSVTEPGNAETTHGYDGQGNLASITDAQAHRTTYTFDDLGRMVAVTSPDSGSTRYAYDPAGNLTAKTDAGGITVQFAHDLLRRPSVVDFPAHGGLSGYSLEYIYDRGLHGKGRLSELKDPSGSTGFTYNSRGRIETKTSTVNGIAFSLSQDLTPAGRTRSVTTATGRTIDYERSLCACRVSRITTSFSGNTTTLFDQLTYLPFGQPSGMQWGNGGTVDNIYDLDGRLITANPGAPKERKLTYDANGHLLTITAANAPWQNRVFSYDAQNRLEEARTPFGTFHYSFDKAGNRLTETQPTGADLYSYFPGSNQIGTITSSTTKTYNHDPSGNTVAIENRTLTYNQDNRLIRVEESGAALGEYSYNGFGQRVTKAAGGHTTFYIYDFEGNLITEANATGTITTEYLYQGSSRLAKADPSTGSIYAYLNDQLGTPQLMTDSTNTVVWEGIYKPFGQAEVNRNSKVVNNFRFAGQYFDAETGYHYNWHRYYDPGAGRYLTPDPIGLAGGINPYLYAGADPINRVDPLGLDPENHAMQCHHNWLEPETQCDLSMAGGMIYDDDGNIIGEIGLEAPNAFLDPVNYVGTFGAGGFKWMNRPYWRYTGPRSNPASPWMTRGWGWKPPYGGNFEKAKDVLQMPFKPCNVKRVDVPWYKPVRGPRLAIQHPEWGQGGGPEYVKGWRWPE